MIVELITNENLTSLNEALAGWLSNQNIMVQSSHTFYDSIDNKHKAIICYYD